MQSELERAMGFEQLAIDFDRMAEKDDSRAAQAWQRSAQKSREAAEHPAASGLQTRAEEEGRIAVYWEESAAFERDMASKCRSLAEEERTGQRLGK